MGKIFPNIVLREGNIFPKQRKESTMDLKKKRVAANLTQDQLAQLCRCDRSMIGRIERGELNPSVKLGKTIADVLGFDWTEFYEDIKSNAEGE